MDWSYVGVLAVGRVDLDSDRGEIFALLGPDGAGKTTIVEARRELLHAHV